MKKDVKKIYDEFWKDIVEKNGVLEKEAVANELYDYHHILEQVPEVYMAITGGVMSKTNYYAKDVIREFEEIHLDKGITWDDVQMMIAECKDLDELKGELKEYFQYDI